MEQSRLGVASCVLFVLVLLCGLGAAVTVLAVPPASGGGEWRGLNTLPWFFAAVLLAACGWLLSLAGFCLGLAGLARPQRKRSAAAAGAILNAAVLVPASVWLLVVALR